MEDNWGVVVVLCLTAADRKQGRQLRECSLWDLGIHKFLPGCASVLHLLRSEAVNQFLTHELVLNEHQFTNETNLNNSQFSKNLPRKKVTIKTSCLSMSQVAQEFCGAVHTNVPYRKKLHTPEKNKISCKSFSYM